MNRELLMLVDAISREKSVDREVVFGAVELALASALPELGRGIALAVLAFGLLMGVLTLSGGLLMAGAATLATAQVEKAAARANRAL